MSDDPMPYDGDPCGCVMCADADATLFFKGDAYCLTCWQAAELTRLRAKDYAADKLAEVYWRLRSYAFHDDDCTINRHPHYRGCSCGLKDALDKGEATIRVFQTVPAAPTDYEVKLAQLKKDFPNGI